MLQPPGESLNQIRPLAAGANRQKSMISANMTRVMLHDVVRADRPERSEPDPHDFDQLALAGVS